MSVCGTQEPRVPYEWGDNIAEILLRGARVCAPYGRNNSLFIVTQHCHFERNEVEPRNLLKFYGYMVRKIYDHI